MLNLSLSDAEITTIRCALELARDKYRENAATLRGIEGHDRLAAQFNRQVIDCETLLDKIEE